jgi:glycosyltransferase involved in cell wall biosynthesis
MKDVCCYVGESWLGSCARSFQEALSRAGLTLEVVHDEPYFPKWRNLALRGALRAGRPLLQHEYHKAILDKVQANNSVLVIVYKGTHLGAKFIKTLQARGCRVVNVYPDCSPLPHGSGLRLALGCYDMVVSTKVWHPEAWRPLYGYDNPCRFIPQGYDPALHYRPLTFERGEYDIGLVATYRPEYGRLILQLAKDGQLAKHSMAIYGNGWTPVRHYLPAGWEVLDAVQGHAYMRALSLAKVYIAPLTREVLIDGRAYPGDEDSTRTYELPAAGCCYVHRRTDYVRTLFEEDKELLLFDSPEELAEKLKMALSDASLRRSLRESAQIRAVPRDSLDLRAAAFLTLLQHEGLLK